MHLFKKLSLAVVAVTTSAALGLTALHQPQATAAPDKTVTIYLTRHGETTGNVMGRVQGWSDFPLTKNGITVANDLGYGLKGIKFDHAYSGTLTRQERTARAVLDKSGNDNVKLTTTNKLREGGYGSFEGDSIAADNAKIAGVYGYQSGDEFQKQTGKDYWNKLQDAYYKLDQSNEPNTKLAQADRAESAHQVQKRMQSEMATIVKNSKNNDKVLVVSSGMSINEYLSTLTGNKYQGAPLKNASVTKIVYHDGHYQIKGAIGSLHYVNKGAQSHK